MKFLILTEIGDSLRNEEGTEGHRQRALDLMEARLQDLYQRSDASRAKIDQPQVAKDLPVLGQGRVKALTGFFEQQATQHQQLIDTNNELIRLRQWLHRENATLTVDGHIVWSKSHRQVVYDHDLEAQNFTRLTFQGQVAYTADGKLLDTRGMVTHFSGPGFAIYVMSEEGHFHVSSHSVGFRHHSSLLAGGKVAAAGELKATDGRITWISNKSGHYAPDPYHLLQAIHGLWLNMGRTLPNLAGLCIDGTWDQRAFSNVGEFLALYGFDNETVECMQILNGYKKFLTPEFLEAHRLRWMRETVQDGELGGIYDLSHGDHRRMPYSDFTALMERLGCVPDIHWKPGTGR